MGEKFTRCFGGGGGNNEENNPKKARPPQGVPSSGAGKDRVSATDQAILDVKARQRKIRTYMEKMEQQDKDATTKIKELLKGG